MTIDLDELERLARAATPGPWTSRGYAVRGPEHPVGFCSGLQDDSPASTVATGPSNAAFIAAANPSAILELLSRIRSLEERNKAAIEDLDEWQKRRDGGRADDDFWIKERISEVRDTLTGSSSG